MARVSAGMTGKGCEFPLSESTTVPQTAIVFAGRRGLQVR